MPDQLQKARELLAQGNKIGQGAEKFITGQGLKPTGFQPTPIQPTPVQQTTTSQHLQAAQNNPVLDQYTMRLQESQGQKPAEPEKPKEPAATPPKPSGQDPIMAQLDRDIASATQRSQDTVAAWTAELDGIKQISTAATAALVDSIKKTYASRIKMMEDTNKRLLAAKTQSGIREGRARYASDMHNEVISAEEQEGLARVGELEGAMLSLIAQAEQARTDKDLEIFNKKMNELDSASKNLQTEVTNLQTLAFDKLKEIREQDKAARDAEKANFDLQLKRSESVAAAGALEFGKLTDPTEQMEYVMALAQYADVPPMVLYGEIYNQLTAQQKAQLDVENLESQIQKREVDAQRDAAKLELNAVNIDSQIAQRAKNTAIAAARETRLIQEQAQRDAEGGDLMASVLDGFTKLHQLTADKRQEVKAELHAKGFGSDAPPAWFKEYLEDDRQQTIAPPVLKTEWIKYRDSVMAGEKDEEKNKKGSGKGIDYDEL